jgi:hypothetical protein
MNISTILILIKINPRLDSGGKFAQIFTYKYLQQGSFYFFWRWMKKVSSWALQVEVTTLKVRE